MEFIFSAIESNPYSSFTFWFLPEDFLGNFTVYKTEDQTFVGTFSYDKMPEGTISEDFERYCKRPEYFLSSNRLHISDKASNACYYDELLAASLLLRKCRKAQVNPDSSITGLRRCLEWLHSTDFYEAPASTQYHESYPGGLVEHHLKVALSAMDMHRLPQFNHIAPDSLILCALVHDWCKIHYYEPYSRNVKNPDSGKWEQVTAYKRSAHPMVPLGHGVTSLILSNRYIGWDVDEGLAIRWHMGEYNVANLEMNELHTANSMYPLVYCLQFADRIACTEYFCDN